MNGSNLFSVICTELAKFLSLDEDLENPCESFNLKSLWSEYTELQFSSEKLKFFSFKWGSNWVGNFSDLLANVFDEIMGVFIFNSWDLSIEVLFSSLYELKISKYYNTIL